MFIVDNLRASGEDKGVLSGTPIVDAWNIFKDSCFTRVPGLHKLDKINLHAGSRSSYGHTNRPGGLSDSLSIINVYKAEAFIFNDS
jgi:hypothetical protein